VGQSVEVVVSELNSASARLEDAAQRLQHGLSSVDDETTQLLGSGWKGGAASAYGPAWEQWHSGAEQVVEGLQRMSELLTIAGREYAKTDESGAEALGSTMQGSGGSAGGSGAAGGQNAGAASDPGAAQGMVGQGTVGQGMVGQGDGASSAGDSNQAAQSGGGAQQAMSSAAQLGQTAFSPLTQAGQAVAGLAQQAAQLATGLAQQAAQDAEDQQDDEPEHPEDAAAPSGEQAAGIAPVESAPVNPGEAMRAVERPGE
jgi:WXG100 family type VII secretion target